MSKWPIFDLVTHSCGAAPALLSDNTTKVQTFLPPRCFSCPPPTPQQEQKKTMLTPSTELLDPPSKPSILDILLVGGKEKETKQKGNSQHKPPATVPKSDVLGKVKNFLGEIAKANEQLAIDAQEKPREEIDLEALTGNEKELIEMDLLLGVADLNSDEAVVAAESSMCGIQSTAAPVSYSSSTEEEEDESDASDNEQENSTVTSEENFEKVEHKEPKKKRQKIVVLN